MAVHHPALRRNPRRTRARTAAPAFGVALVLLLVAVMISVTVGARAVHLDEFLRVFSGEFATIGQTAIAQRVPRTLIGIIVGAALAISGLSLQAVSRNPLADPGIFGLTSGSALAVVVSITLLGIRSPAEIVIASLVGAAGVAVLLFAVSNIGPGGSSPLKLVLSGAAISVMATSVTSALILPRPDAMETFRFWQIGGIGGATWGSLAWSTPIVVIVLVGAFLLTRSMNALALGDDMARGLGERLAGARFFITACAVVLAAIATSIAGPIGFVGLIVPHVCRRIVGSNHRVLVPLSALGGAVLLVLADVVGRVMLPPSEVEAGIITAILGAPVLIWIVRRNRTAIA